MDFFHNDFVMEKTRESKLWFIKTYIYYKQTSGSDSSASDSSASESVTSISLPVSSSVTILVLRFFSRFLFFFNNFFVSLLNKNWCNHKQKCSLFKRKDYNICLPVLPFFLKNFYFYGMKVFGIIKLEQVIHIL